MHRTIAAPANDVGTWRDQQVCDWLLLILRFAITRSAGDHAAALAFSGEIDGIGAGQRYAGPRFFLRTATEVCAAISGIHNPSRQLILQTHAKRIDNSRLRQAFLATVDLGEKKMSARKAGGRMAPRGDLWRGLSGA